ncbi:MAG TPA: transposase [Ktedonobacterales bacterium]|nr:transposase [Ktedonobacterales bacterium]
MSRCDPVSPWQATVSTHLPQLSRSQARCLAEWSYAVAVTACAGTSTAAAFLANLQHERENTVRQRLREWYQEATHKRGARRREVGASACFAALLGWVLAWWPPSERRLALALDATSLRDYFTVLSISVVYRGCAIPVAWAVTRANTPGAWRPHWERLVRLVGERVPVGWLVLALADRGLYARWLFDAIQQQGWHPFLRVTTCGLCRPVTPTPHGDALGTAQRLADLAPQVGTQWCGVAQCFTTADRRLRCTVLACWDAPHTDRWLIVTDLAPTQAQVAWYGLRGWIEQGFKDLKRGGWGWQHTKMTDPARAERYWVVLAVATLWMISTGAEAEARSTASASGLPALPPGTAGAVAPPRRLSVFRRGRLTVLAALVLGHQPPLGFFARSFWPGDQTAAPQGISGLPPLAGEKTYP